MDIETLLEDKERTLTIGGKPFTFKEMTGKETRRYLRRVEAVMQGARDEITQMESASVADIAEVSLRHEEAFFAGLLGESEEWIRDNMTTPDKLRVFATIDEVNNLGPQVKNWERLREEAGALKVLKLTPGP